MLIKELTVCTSNQGKASEISRILGIPTQARKLSLDEIQSIDPVVVSRHKIAQAFEQVRGPVIVDDTGFGLRALGGFPGALIAWVLSAGGLALPARMLSAGAERAAAVETAIAYADERGVEVFVGRIEGHIVDIPRGANGFGFDPIFVPDGEELTLAEMSDQKKDSLSPRAFALAKLRTYLSSGA